MNGGLRDQVEAALGYARRGFAVFPCEPGGKKPLTAHGFQDASDDLERVRAWWQEHPTANVGIAIPEGVMVLDVDVKSGGPDSLQELEGEHTPLPRTRTARTAGGGFHYWYRLASEANLSRRVGFRPGLDLLVGGSGYVIAPPSKVGAGAYEWIDDSPVADCPAWLLNLAVSEPKPEAARRESRAIPEGSRNATLTRIAGAMRRQGCSEGTILAALHAENQTNCDPPLPEREVGRIACSVARYAPSERVRTNELYEQTHCLAEHPGDLAREALHGWIGDFVSAIEPHTEAAIPALAVQGLTFAGAVFGRSAYYRVGSTRHFSNLFVALVGSTAKARKGDSLRPVEEVFAQAFPDFSERVKSGLSSAEGLIFHVRDDAEPELDRRLLAVETEFASPLQRMRREGNTLSATLRDAWDGRELSTLTKKDAIRAGDAHVAMIAHVTVEELRRELSRTEELNGFANRFLWVYCERSKKLPFGGNLAHDWTLALCDSLRRAEASARNRGRIAMSAEAANLWRDAYDILTEPEEGIVGAVLARAEAQVVRLALVYALLDGSAEIRFEHLKAALAVWEYCESSVRYIWAGAERNPLADRLLRELRRRGSLTLREAHEATGRNYSGEKIRAALDVLTSKGWVQKDETREGGVGRPAESYTLAG